MSHSIGGRYLGKSREPLTPVRSFTSHARCVTRNRQTIGALRNAIARRATLWKQFAPPRRASKFRQQSTRLLSRPAMTFHSHARLDDAARFVTAHLMFNAKSFKTRASSDDGKGRIKKF